MLRLDALIFLWRIQNWISVVRLGSPFNIRGKIGAT
jgi:hypothetical protein